MYILTACDVHHVTISVSLIMWRLCLTTGTEVPTPKYEMQTQNVTDIESHLLVIIVINNYIVNDIVHAVDYTL